MFAQQVELAGRQIGSGQPCFLIAEAGVNHNGDPEMAKELIRVAARAGADAVKFQMFTADRIISPSAAKAEYQRQTTGSAESESQLEMVRRLELPDAAWRELVEVAGNERILFLCTPFDEESADALEGLSLAAYKIPSGELTNLSFLTHVAGKGRPVILSTGMATLGEVEAAVDAIARAGNRKLILLHCVSSYPARPVDVNLRAMETLRAAFGVPVGFSDHTQGIQVALAAAALGACVIEKHFTLDRALPGPDHQASLEPPELAELVRGVAIVQSAIGDGHKRPVPAETDVAAAARKSLAARHALEAGRRLVAEDVALVRPGTGLPPAMLPNVVGRSLRHDVAAGELLSWEDLA